MRSALQMAHCGFLERGAEIGSALFVVPQDYRMIPPPMIFKRIGSRSIKHPYPKGIEGGFNLYTYVHSADQRRSVHQGTWTGDPTRDFIFANRDDWRHKRSSVTHFLDRSDEWRMLIVPALLNQRSFLGSYSLEDVVGLFPTLVTVFPQSWTPQIGSDRS